MLNMIKGCRVHDPSVLHEGYQQTQTGFVANVNAEKIHGLLESFIKLHNEQCFLILEVPTNQKDELKFRAKGNTVFHKDVYYLDDMTPERAMELLNVFGQWLIHDGLSSVGIGLHSGANEILLGKYNVVTVYTKDRSKYTGFFEVLEIPEVIDLKTAWDYFTSDSPGESFAYSHNGKNIYDLVKHLKQYGLYFAERREA